MIVVVGGEKGGVGKTTIAVHLAYLLARSGRDPLLIDADPQQSASTFCAARDASGLEPRIRSVQKMGRGLAHDVRDLAPRYSDIVIDTGGRDSAELRLAALVADALLIPINPTAYNWWTLERMDELAAEASLQNERLGAYVILNNVPSNWTLTAPVVSTAVDRIHSAEFRAVKMLGSYLIHRSVYGVNEESGRTAFEPRARDGKTDARAQEEMGKLFEEVFGYAAIRSAA